MASITRFRTTTILSTAFAALMLGSTVAGASSPVSPTGDVGQWEFGFRDVNVSGVVCTYPERPNPLKLGSFRVRGPRVQWLETHPLPKGSVSWRVIVRTAPTKQGPWTIEKKTPAVTILAFQDTWRTFDDRTVSWKDRSGKLFVRLTSKLTWHNEDGGVMGWVKRTYDRYSLAETDSTKPGFRGHPVRKGSCPNRWSN